MKALSSYTEFILPKIIVPPCLGFGSGITTLALGSRFALGFVLKLQIRVGDRVRVRVTVKERVKLG